MGKSSHEISTSPTVAMSILLVLMFPIGAVIGTLVSLGALPLTALRDWSIGFGVLIGLYLMVRFTEFPPRFRSVKSLFLNELWEQRKSLIAGATFFALFFLVLHLQYPEQNSLTEAGLAWLAVIGIFVIGISILHIALPVFGEWLCWRQSHSELRERKPEKM